MTDQATTSPTDAETAVDHLVSAAFAGWHGQLLHVLCRLGVVDLLADGPRTAAELAAEVPGGAAVDSLRRCLTAGVATGVLARAHGDRYAVTPLGQPLRSDVPYSVRPLVLMAGAPFTHALLGDLLSTVRTGTSAAPRVLGAEHLYAHLAAHPDQQAVFDEAMVAMTGLSASMLAEAYDFGRFDELVDVGGGQGQLLAAVLARHPGPKGVLLDQPTVVAGAGPVLDRAGVADRVRTVGGDMFTQIPFGADGYLLKNVLHNWPDERCRAILARLREAVRPGGRVLIVEAVLDGDRQPSATAALMDLCMMATWGARERTPAEWRALLTGTGFELETVVDVLPWQSILEVRPAG
ncbi:methyltransferase [Micromonosporaceae bacterium B7E4]